MAQTKIPTIFVAAYVLATKAGVLVAGNAHEVKALITANDAKLTSANSGSMCRWTQMRTRKRKTSSFSQHRIRRNPRQRARQEGTMAGVKKKEPRISMLGSLAGARKGKAKEKAKKIRLISTCCTTSVLH